MATTLGPQTSPLANQGSHAAPVLLCVLHCSSLYICLGTMSRGSGGSKERKMQSPQTQDSGVYWARRRNENGEDEKSSDSFKCGEIGFLLLISAQSPPCPPGTRGH